MSGFQFSAQNKIKDSADVDMGIFLFLPAFSSQSTGNRSSWDQVAECEEEAALVHLKVPHKSVLKVFRSI